MLFISEAIHFSFLNVININYIVHIFFTFYINHTFFDSFLAFLSESIITKYTFSNNLNI